MSIDFLRGVRSALSLATVATLGTMVATGAHAKADDQQQQDGRIVAISPDGVTPAMPQPDNTLMGDDHNDAPAAPAFWLGIQGQPLQSDVLRTHLQLAEGVGVVIEQVVPSSPAEKAGLRKHDVLLDVNGEQISDMAVLQKAVADSGGKALDLKIIRLAKEMTVSVTPEAPPADIASLQLGANGGGVPGMPAGQMGELNAMLQQLQQNGLGGGVRVFGPGMIMSDGAPLGDGGGVNLQNVPHNVQVTITRKADEPAKITIKRGEDSWTLQSDDQEALAKLPDDVRPFVEQMLQTGQNGAPTMHQFPGGGGVQGALPAQLGSFHFNFDGAEMNAARQQAAAAARNAARAALGGAQDANEGMIRRLEDLEKHLQRLEDELHEQSGNASQDSSESTSH